MTLGKIDGGERSDHFPRAKGFDFDQTESVQKGFRRFGGRLSAIERRPPPDPSLQGLDTDTLIRRLMEQVT